MIFPTKCDTRRMTFEHCKINNICRLDITGWKIVLLFTLSLRCTPVERNFRSLCLCSPKIIGIGKTLYTTELTMTIIPTIALTELGVRGSVALYFIGLISSNDIGIVTASFTLWFINLAIPAIIGSAFVLRMNIFKSREQMHNKVS